MIKPTAMAKAKLTKRRARKKTLLAKKKAIRVKLKKKKYRI
jgi:hypothetical protein